MVFGVSKKPVNVAPWRSVRSDRHVGPPGLIVALLLALAVLLLSGLLQPAVGYALILGTCVFLGVVLGKPAGDASGLKEYHQ